MLRKYLQAAMRRAQYELLENGEGYFGKIPGFDGVWANASALETCRDELEEVLEEWILFRVSKQLELPVIDGIEIRVREVA